MEIKTVLLTNDDGFHAAGLQTLYQQLRSVVKTIVVAPDRERSAVGHGITMHQPLRVIPMGQADSDFLWSVDGTPADCVKIALDTLLKNERPDLIISGINRGPNLGSDVLYSGTVSAAIEGSMYGLPSIAASLAGYGKVDFDMAAGFIAANLGQLAERAAANAVLNLNFPELNESEVYCGVKYTQLGNRVYENVFEERKDPRGRIYYWMGGEALHCEQAANSDIWAVENNYVSITPLHSDLTDYRYLQRRTGEGESWEWRLPAG